MGGKPRMPAGLAAGGRRLWREIIDVYEFDPAETRVLVDLCRQADLVDELAAAVAADGVMVPTADGTGKKLNTAVTELRQARLAVARLAAVLKLPELADDDERPRQQRREGARGVYAIGGGK